MRPEHPTACSDIIRYDFKTVPVPDTCQNSVRLQDSTGIRQFGKFGTKAHQKHPGHRYTQPNTPSDFSFRPGSSMDRMTQQCDYSSKSLNKRTEAQTQIFGQSQTNRGSKARLRTVWLIYRHARKSANGKLKKCENAKLITWGYRLEPASKPA